MLNICRWTLYEPFRGGWPSNHPGRLTSLQLRSAEQGEVKKRRENNTFFSWERRPTQLSLKFETRFFLLSLLLSIVLLLLLLLLLVIIEYQHSHLSGCDGHIAFYARRSLLVNVGPWDQSWGHIIYLISDKNFIVILFIFYFWIKKQYSILLIVSVLVLHENHVFHWQR